MLGSKGCDEGEAELVASHGPIRGDIAMRKAVRYTLAPIGAIVAVIATAVPASAFHCTNPQKNTNAPDAGVNYMLVGFAGEEPILQKIGPGKGIGGWVAVAPGVFGNTIVQYTSPHNVVGGPGSQKAEHACDDKGIDYLHC